MQFVAQLGVRRAQQRAQQAQAAGELGIGCDAGQTGEARAAKERQQDGFGLVLRGVSGHDRRRVVRGGDFGECRVARVAQARLVVAAGARRGDADGSPQARAHGQHHAFVLPCRFAQPGIHMDQNKLEAVGARDAVEDGGQRDRIRAAAAGRHDRSPDRPRHRGPNERVEGALRFSAAQRVRVRA